MSSQHTGTRRRLPARFLPVCPYVSGSLLPAFPCGLTPALIPDDSAPSPALLPRRGARTHRNPPLYPTCMAEGTCVVSMETSELRGRNSLESTLAVPRGNL